MACNAMKMGAKALFAGLLALGLSVATGAPAHASPQYSLDCTSCHSMPPTDSGTTKKNPFTGGIPGNHQKHATANAGSCVVCHGAAVTGYGTNHRNKTIEVVDGFNYERKINGFLNQTSVPPAQLGGCSNVACHGNGKGSTRPTPKWGSAAFSVANGDCVQCHDIAPASGNHPVAGSKHANYLGTGTGSCVNCHSDHAGQGANAFQHATSAGKRAIDVRFASGGSFASNQCSNVYCHSNGKGAYAAPTWGGTLDCAGCHGTATSNTLSGAHAAHVNNPSYLGTNYGCADCHAGSVTNNSTIGSYTNHVNGQVTFGSSNVGTPSSGTCATAYCHSDGKGNNKSINWSTVGPLNCKACHGSDAGQPASIAGEPNYLNAGIDQPKANSHKNHVISAASCQNCHADTTVDGTSIKAGGFHTNNSADVRAGNGKSFSIASKSCSNVSCHSGNGILTGVGAAKWGDSLGCNSCHGDAGTLNSYAHAKHVNAKGYACDTCHAATVSGSSTIVDHSLHGNGVRDVANFYTSANSTCATSCHLSSTPNWKDNSSAACGSCHNALSTTTNGLIASYAHNSHFGAVYGPKLDGTTTNSCAICHVYTTDTAASHVNGTVNLNANYASNGTCGTCHNVSADWRSAAGTRIACESCHTGSLSVISGATAPDKSKSISSGHGYFSKGCTDCHDNTSAHIGVPGGTKRLLSGLTGSSNAECNYCHQDSGKVQPSHLNMQAHDSTANSCAACHDPHGTDNSKMVRSTLGSTAGVTFGGSDFVNGSGTGVCQACHTSTLYYKKGVSESNHPSSNCLECHQHNTAAGTAFTPNRACDSCHGYPPAPRRTNDAVTFGVHGQWSSARFEDYSGGGGAHLLAAHISQDVKPSDQWAPCLPCHSGGAAKHQRIIPARSHVENVNVIVDPQYRFSDVAQIIYSSAKLVSGGSNKTGSCFNVSCHFKQSKPWSIER